MFFTHIPEAPVSELGQVTAYEYSSCGKEGSDVIIFININIEINFYL
jgi:hypothetical protein